MNVFGFDLSASSSLFGIFISAFVIGLVFGLLRYYIFGIFERKD